MSKCPILKICLFLQSRPTDFKFHKKWFICIIFSLICSLGTLESTLPREMVSRRKILSRSRDDLNLDQSYVAQEEEEDIWYQKDKLYKVINSKYNLYIIYLFNLISIL